MFKQKNYKNFLLDIAVKYFSDERPQYFHAEYGPHHAKVFLCVCAFQKQTSSAMGRTKLEAEQAASRAILKQIKQCFFEFSNGSWTFSLSKKEPALSKNIATLVRDLSKDKNHFDVLSLYGGVMLKYFISRYLFDTYPHLNEALLSRIAHQNINAKTRSIIAKKIGLDTQTDENPSKMLCIIIGKLSLSQTEEVAKHFVMDCYQTHCDYTVIRLLSSNTYLMQSRTQPVIRTTIKNSKSELFEYAQKNQFSPPKYKIIRKSGEDHSPEFVVECSFLNNNEMGSAQTIKSAEQSASEKMMELIFTYSSTLRTLSQSNYTSKDKGSYINQLTEQELKQLNACTGYAWPISDNQQTLVAALTHPSASTQTNYERLEFLGDAILQKVLLRYILQQYPDITEKAILSSLTDQLACADTQADIARSLSLDYFILSHTPITTVTLSDALEALVAAIYLNAESHCTMDESKQNTDKNTHAADSVIIAWFHKKILCIIPQTLQTQDKSHIALHRQHQTTPKNNAQGLLSDLFPMLPTKQPKPSDNNVNKASNYPTYASIVGLRFSREHKNPAKDNASLSTSGKISFDDDFPALPTMRK